ncbi:TniQ family protein [Paenibacillus taichungensis]
MKNRKFGLRVIPKLGESFSSVILRSAALNGCDAMDIWRYTHIRGEDMLRTHLFYRLDYDFRLIDFDKLKDLLGISSEPLRNLSFFTVCSKFLNNPYQDYDKASLMIQSAIEKHKRKYCPLCFKDEKVFKLIWQVKSINSCEIHGCNLISHCLRCQSPIDYKSDNMRCKNSNCSKYLWDVIDYEDISNLSPNKSENFERWLFLINPNQQLTKDYKNLTMEKSLVLKLLYVAQNQENIYKRKNILGVGETITKSLVSFIRGKSEIKKANIQLLFDVLDFSSITIEEFANIEVPNSYIYSLLQIKKRRVKLPQSCLSQWCENSESSTFIFKDERVEQGRPKIRYPYFYICPNCFLRYSYHPITERWTEIDNRIELLMTVRKLAEGGMTRLQISRELKIDFYKTSELLGYLAYYQLLTEPIAKSFIANSVPCDLLILFEMLECDHRSYHGKKYKQAKELFSWDLKTFSYYYAHKIVKLSFVNKASQLKKPLKKNRNILNETVECIARLSDENMKLSLSKVAAATRRSARAYKAYHEIKEIVRMAKDKQFTEKLISEEKELHKKFQDFMKIHDADKRILKSEVYAYLNKNRDYVLQKYPELINYMSKCINKFHEQLNERKDNGKIALIKHGITDIIANQTRLSVTAVAKYLGIKNIHSNGYKHIKQMIVQEIDNFILLRRKKEATSIECSSDN